MKSVSRDPTVRTRSASRASVFVAGVPSRPMPPSCHHAACWTAPLPAKVSATGMPDRGGEALQLGGGLRVDDPAAGDDQRLLGLLREAPRLRRSRTGRGPVGGSPSRARRRTRRGSRRRGTGRPGGARAPRRRSRPGRRGSASPPGSAVRSCSGRVIRSKNRADRPERVVHGQVGVGRVLELLQHRALVPGGVGVPGQQQHREPVQRRQGGAGDHVHRAGSDGGGHREGGVAVVVLGERGRRVDQGLLVAALDERHRLGELVQRLAEAGDVAVAEDAEGRRDQPAAVRRRRRSTAGTGR